MGNGLHRNKHSVKKIFENMPLSGKIVLIVIGGILIPFLIISIIVFGNIYENTMASQNMLRRVNLGNAVSSVDSMMADYEDAAEGVYDYENFLKNATAAEKISAETVNIDSSVNMMLSDIRGSRQYIAGVSFIFTDGTYVINTSGYGKFEEIVNDTRQNLDAIMEEMNGARQPASWRISMGERIEKDGNAVFFSGRKAIRNIYDKNELIGMIVVYFSTLSFDKVKALENYNEHSILAILDKDYHLIWTSTDAAPVFELLEEKKNEISVDNPAKFSQYKNYYFICQDSDYSGWHFINMIPKAEVNRQTDSFIWFFMIVVGMIVFFCVLCMQLVRRSVVYPIRRMIVVMEEIDDLNKIKVALPVNQNDEIGCLYKTYNRLNERIDMLVSQLTEAMAQDKEKEIKLLHSQLNPHFIYNTLECISWVAYEHQVPEVSKVVNCLSEILKYSIKFSDNQVTFGTELEMLKNYIYIQHFRFEDKFSISYEVDQSLLQYKTIKFTFQPFVENALVHGFKDRSRDCKILIRLYEEKGDIITEIEDNGCGMDEMSLNHVLKMNTEGIGIGNINKSLQLRFGVNYHIEIESAPGRGTKVRMRIPK